MIRENELCLQYHVINTVLFKIFNSLILCFVLAAWLYHLMIGLPAAASPVPHPIPNSEAVSSPVEPSALGPDLWQLRDAALATLPSIPVEPRSLFRKSKRDLMYEQAILQAADQFDMEPAMIKAVIMAESSFNPKARSRVGAQGLMQLMPRTAAAMGVADAFDPHHNIQGGAKYLKYLLGRYNGNIELALAAYNAGSRNVRRYNGVPPFKATQAYIVKVLKYYKFYKASPSGGIS